MSDNDATGAPYSAEHYRHEQVLAEDEVRECWMALDVEGIRAAEQRISTARATAHRIEYGEQLGVINSADRIAAAIPSRSGRNKEVPVTADAARAVLAEDVDGELQVQIRSADAVIVQRYSRMQPAVERLSAPPIAGGAELPSGRRQGEYSASGPTWLKRCRTCQRTGPWNTQRKISFEPEATFCGQCAAVLDGVGEHLKTRVEEHAALSIACDLRMTYLIGREQAEVADIFDEHILPTAVERRMRDAVYGRFFERRSPESGRYELKPAVRRLVAAQARSWLEHFASLSRGRRDPGLVMPPAAAAFGE